MALTDKQQAFVSEYLRCWNASEAARRAGYAEATAYSQGQRLLKNVEVVALIEQRKAELMMSADEVLTRLTEQARATYSAYFTADGAVDLESLLADGKGHLIKKIKPTKDGLEIEFCDAQTAIFTIAKIHGLLRERTEVSGPAGGPIRTEQTVKHDLTKLNVEELSTLRGIVAKATIDAATNAG